MANKKYYWLKLDKDFFKRHDIKIIESMENGKDYLIFYMKLLCESVSHEGNLRFSDTIPYNNQMLSTITNTNIDIVKSAVNIFTELEMMQMLDDNTIYMTEVEKMVGSKTKEAIRKAEYRSKKKVENASIGTLSQKCPTEIEKELELEKEIRVIEENKNVEQTQLETFLNIDHFKNTEANNLLIEFVKTKKGSRTLSTAKRIVKKLSAHSSDEVIEALETALNGKYGDVFPKKKFGGYKNEVASIEPEWLNSNVSSDVEVISVDDAFGFKEE